MSSREIFDDLRPKLPVHHTRRIRREYFQLYVHISCVTIPPHVLRSINCTQTGYATADQNPGIYQRVCLAIWGSDPELVIDLHQLNTFDTFYDILEQELEDMKAVDERHQGG